MVMAFIVRVIIYCLPLILWSGTKNKITLRQDPDVLALEKSRGGHSL